MSASSTTVLRVKRRLEDNPQDALVVTCKRLKTSSEDLSPSLFVFRGTVDSQETEQIISVVPKSEVKLQPTHDVKDIVNKLRKEHKDKSNRNRYEIVNCCRGLKTDEENAQEDFNLVDLRKSDDIDESVEYAYDLYTVAKQDFDISNIDNFASIETDLILDSQLSNGQDAASGDEVDDDDDSNDENNWRNDYPDSDASTIDEDDMVQAMQRVDLEDLSSDDGEDHIFETKDYEENIKLYGMGYAKYKAKILSENPDLSLGNLIHCNKIKEMDEESTEGYKDDSDDGFYYGQEEDSEQFRDQYKESSDEYTPD